MHILYSLLILCSFCFNLYSQNYNNVLVAPSDQINAQTSQITQDFKNKKIIIEESLNVQKNPRNVLMSGVVIENRISALLILGDLCQKGTQTKADTDAILYAIKNDGATNVKAMAMTYYGFCMHNDLVDGALYNFIKQGTTFATYNSTSQILSFIGTGGLASLLDIDIPTPGASDATTLFLGAVRGLTASSTAKSTLLLMALNKDYIDSRTLRTNYSPDSFLGKIQVAILEGLYEKAVYGDALAEKYLQAQMKLNKGNNLTKLGNPYYDETSKVISTFLIAKLKGKEALPYLNAIGNSSLSSADLKGECAYWADKIDPRPGTIVYASGTATSYRTAVKPNYSNQYQVALFKKLEQDQANGVEFIKCAILWVATDGLFYIVGPTVKTALTVFSKSSERLLVTELGTVADLTGPSAIKTLTNDVVKTVSVDSKLASVNVTKTLANQSVENVVFVDSKAAVGNIGTKNVTGNLVDDAVANGVEGEFSISTGGSYTPVKTTPNINPSGGGYTDVAVKSNVSVIPKVVTENTVLVSPKTLTALSTSTTIKNLAVVSTLKGVSYLVDPTKQSVTKLSEEQIQEWKHPAKLVEEFKEKELVSIEITQEDGSVLTYTVWLDKGEKGAAELEKIIANLKPLGEVKVNSSSYDKEGKLISKQEESPYAVTNSADDAAAEDIIANSDFWDTDRTLTVSLDSITVFQVSADKRTVLMYEDIVDENGAVKNMLVGFIDADYGLGPADLFINIINTKKLIRKNSTEKPVGVLLLNKLINVANSDYRSVNRIGLVLADDNRRMILKLFDNEQSKLPKGTKLDDATKKELYIKALKRMPLSKTLGDAGYTEVEYYNKNGVEFLFSKPIVKNTLIGTTINGEPIIIKKLDPKEAGLENLSNSKDPNGPVAVQVSLGDKTLIGISRPVRNISPEDKSKDKTTILQKNSNIKSPNLRNASQATYDLAQYINKKVGKNIINVVNTLTYSTEDGTAYTFEEWLYDATEKDIKYLSGDIYIFDFITANIDRQPNSNVLKKNEKLYLIDNELAFPEGLQRNTQLNMVFLHHIHREGAYISDEIRKFISEVDPNEVVQVIAPHIKDVTQHKLMVERIRYVRDKIPSIKNKAEVTPPLATILVDGEAYYSDPEYKLAWRKKGDTENALYSYDHVYKRRHRLYDFTKLLPSNATVRLGAGIKSKANKPGRYIYAAAKFEDGTIGFDITTYDDRHLNILEKLPLGIYSAWKPVTEVIAVGELELDADGKISRINETSGLLTRRTDLTWRIVLPGVIINNIKALMKADPNFAQLFAKEVDYITYSNSSKHLAPDMSSARKKAHDVTNILHQIIGAHYFISNPEQLTWLTNNFIGDFDNIVELYPLFNKFRNDFRIMDLRSGKISKQELDILCSELDETYNKSILNKDPANIVTNNTLKEPEPTRKFIETSGNGAYVNVQKEDGSIISYSVTERSFEAIALLYVNHMIGPNERMLDEKLSLYKFLGLLKGKRVLDVGVGASDFVSTLRGHGVEAYGLDINLREEFKSQDYYFESPANNTSFADGSFDVIFSTRSVLDYEYFNEKLMKSTLKELLRILKPGGSLFFTIGLAKKGEGKPYFISEDGSITFFPDDKGLKASYNSLWNSYWCEQGTEVVQIKKTN